MITSRFEVQPAGELPPPPTKSHSALLSAEKPFYEVGGMAADLVPQLSSVEERKRIADKLDVINMTMSDPRSSNTQAALNYVSELGSAIGATIPLAYLGAEIAGAGAVGIGAGFEAAAPEAALSFARTPITKLVKSGLSDYLPSLTPAELAKGTAEAYGAYKGMVLPEHVVENYHKNNDTLDVRGAIKDWASDNFGFLLPLVPFAAGYTALKIAKVGREAKEAASHAKRMVEDHQLKTQMRNAQIRFAQSQATKSAYEAAEEVRRATELEKGLDHAVNSGAVTKEHAEWYKSYLANPDDHEGLMKGALDVLKNEQLPFDRVTGRVWFPLLESKDLKQLKSAIKDEVSNNLSTEEQRGLSSYIIHNRMDAIRQTLSENPNMSGALDMFTHYIDRKIKSKSSALAELDKILEQHGSKGLKKNEAFSQKRIYKHLKKKGISDIREVPYGVPDNVAKRLDIAKRIDDIQRQASPRYKQWFMEGVHEKLKEDLKSIKLFTPEEELKDLRSKLFKKGGLRKNVFRSRPYRRLQELADLWYPAKHLLDRVHLEHVYGKQEAFNNVLKQFVNFVDSNAARLADPNKVVNYMKGRIEKVSPELKEFKPVKPVTAREFKDVKATSNEEDVGASDVLKEEKAAVEASSADEAKKEFQSVEMRFQQFNENQSILDDAVECMWRSING